MAEMLAFSGNIERADVILDASAELDPTAALVVAEFRQLLRGELARRQLFSDGRVPEFLGEPTTAQRLSLAAIVALRNGDPPEAAKLAGHAEEARAHPAGTVRGTSFDDMRDADDLLPGHHHDRQVFLDSAGRVVTLDFMPKRPRDLFWRRDHAGFDGPDGEVYLPAIPYTDDQRRRP
jgi:type VI secretion system protein ImpE